MPNKSEIQIFLAHATEDKARVLELYERLKRAGYKPWLDKKDLIPGQNWRDEIHNAIKNSQLFIACLSERSIAKAGYVQKEFKLALSKYSEMPSRRIYIIPLRLDECEIPDLRQEEYGVNLRDLHWLDYWEEDGFKQLERAIAYQYGPFTETAPPTVATPAVAPAEPQATETPLIVTPSAQGLQVFKFEVVAVNARGKQINKEPKQAQYFTEDLGNGVTLDMVSVPGGKFLMGTEDEEIERLVKKFNWVWFRKEKPQHEVTVQSFFMGKYPITQAQWRAIASRTDLRVERDLNLNPSYFKGDGRPVEQVSWYEAIEFCARLSKLAGQEYRLPSEAEWEYACRSVISYQLSVISEELTNSEWNEKYNQPFHFGETITGELANYNAGYTYANEAKGQYRKQTTPVGQFPPNEFGLYDMCGNVWEWCEDDWHDNYESAPTDGIAWLSRNKGSAKIIRGGSWGGNPRNCRSAYRSSLANLLNSQGFRVVCVPPRTS
jgi:formylglycine-generating enzyme required for sulfatase activity